ncbi:MAG: hypothetical protein BWY65_00088 [Firmicutes bacterium ADurb.Bin373]|nr:MAG: hypothetical protein BWY65_00088 [Firmicutes bacterium ADurb.Bin373]
MDWDEATQTVVCWPAGQEKPDVSAAVEYLTSGQLPVQGNTVNGYVVPAKTELRLADPNMVKGDKHIVFNIDIKKGNLEQKYADAESILLQTLDADTTAKAIEFAKVTQEALLSGKPWDIKDFRSPNGMTVRVGAGWGGTSIQFSVWQAN